MKQIILALTLAIDFGSTTAFANEASDIGIANGPGRASYWHRKWPR